MPCRRSRSSSSKAGSHWPHLAMVLGLATRLMVGSGCVTDTIADCEALPLEPEQLRVKVALVFSVPVTGNR